MLESFSLQAQLWRHQTVVAVKRRVQSHNVSVLVTGLLALSGLAVSASARAQAPAAAPGETAAAKSATGSATGYVIGPADVLQIIVWKEPDLSRPVTVRFDGMVTFPLLGDILAAGRTPAQLAASLTEGLRRFVESPRVTVGLEQANSARLYVLGQVNKSGEFPLGAPTTVLQALALAGGFKDFAKTDAIVIVRRDQSVVPVNYKRIADGKDAAQNILLLPGDTVVVP